MKIRQKTEFESKPLYIELGVGVEMDVIFRP